MRKYIILTVLAIFLVGSAWLLLNTLSPFDEDKLQLLIAIEEIDTKADLVATIQDLSKKGLLIDYLNLSHVFLIGGLILVAIGIIFTLAHLLIDRFWWSKFYQQPSLTNAIRRAVLVDMGIISIVFYRLYAAPWHLAYLTLLLLIIVETLITKFLEKPKEDKEHDHSAQISE